LSTTAAARSEAEKEVAAAFQVLSDLPGEGSTFRNLNPVASWTLTHLTCEPLPTRTLWHDFLPPSEPSANLASSPGCSTPEKMSAICQIEVSIHVEPAIWHPDLLAARNLVAAGWLPGDWMTARQPCQIDSRENLQGNEG